MELSPEEMRARISKKYIGKAGIHAISIHQAANAITVYHSPASSPERDDVFVQLKADAAPMLVKFIEVPVANLA